MSRLPGAIGERIRGNVRSSEPDVNAIVGKLRQRAVDAAFVYVSDVKAAEDSVRALPLPGEVQPTVVYAAAVVQGAEQPELAQRYVEGLAAGRCYEELQAQGFGPVK
jgi:molybdate transport system substrate-binding protein